MTIMNSTRLQPLARQAQGRAESAPGLGAQLTPRTIASWEARLGLDRRTMARPDRFVGHEGIRAWNDDVRILSDDPAQFRAVRHSREMSMMSAFCALHSAVRMTSAEQPSAGAADAASPEMLLVAVTAMPGKSVVRQNGQAHAYGAGDLLFISTSMPFESTTTAVADPSGLAIPLRVLGKHRSLAEQRRRPLSARTPLSRAAAGLVRRFAADSAASTMPAPSADAELAVIDLLTAAMAELAGGDRSVLQDDSLANHQAAIDLIARRHRDPDFTPDSIAADLHLSRRQLYRLFENADQSLASRIADVRVETARELLVANPWQPISSIAASSGFRSVATFRNRFKTRYGVGPVEYRHRSLA
ncbi:helix-turn-helix domain-containing protein [Gordonia zhaorongruii]|uniref:helix-turn-helix domain-containing protein n=1 Tax=Gordonia zhaorongruii TaxID=2597659 RepID=UPI001F206075|nr:helix-turn-helix domain-containing protein [Gordonia zhaorongruii]